MTSVAKEDIGGKGVEHAVEDRSVIEERRTKAQPMVRTTAHVPALG